MSMKKLTGEGAKFENQGGTLVVDLESDSGTLRFIFEDGYSYMVALMVDGEPLKTEVVSVEDSIEDLRPKTKEADSEEESSS